MAALSSLNLPEVPGDYLSPTYDKAGKKITTAGTKAMLVSLVRTKPEFVNALVANLAATRAAAAKIGPNNIGCTGTDTKRVEQDYIACTDDGKTKLTTKATTKEYPTIKVCNRSFKAQNVVYVHDRLEEFQGNTPASYALIARFIKTELSHICGDRGCLTAGHIVTESSRLNKSRQLCHGASPMKGMCPHSPNCIRSPPKKKEKIEKA